MARVDIGMTVTASNDSDGDDVVFLSPPEEVTATDKPDQGAGVPGPKALYKKEKVDQFKCEPGGHVQGIQYEEEEDCEPWEPR